MNLNLPDKEPKLGLTVLKRKGLKRKSLVEKHELRQSTSGAGATKR